MFVCLKQTVLHVYFGKAQYASDVIRLRHVPSRRLETAHGFDCLRVRRGLLFTAVESMPVNTLVRSTDMTNDAGHKQRRENFGRARVCVALIQTCHPQRAFVTTRWDRGSAPMRRQRG